jgi:hypothetical protein
MDANPGNASGLRVLLIEDHADSARAMARLLRTFGYEVDVAHGIVEGRDKVEGNPIDLLISDLLLPDGSGLDFMRTLRATRPQLKAIAISGFTQSSDVKESIDAGFNAHVAKPVDFNKLREVIEQVVRE